MGISIERRDTTGLFQSLERLDLLLADAVERAHDDFGPEARADPFRGLHLSDEHVERLLARQPGAPLSGRPVGHNGAGPDAGPLEVLAREHGLTAFDADALLIALGAEVDLRYERIYAYLQDDVTRKRPSVDLVLNVLCETREEKLARRARFLPGAPLVDARLVEVVAPANGEPAPLLAHVLKVDDQIVRELLGGAGLDARLTHLCTLEPAADGGPAWMPPSKAGWLGSPAALHLHGAPRPERLAVARAIAQEGGDGLIAADLSELAAAPSSGADTIELIFREARQHRVLLYLDPLDALAGERAVLLDAVYSSWRTHPGPVISGAGAGTRTGAPFAAAARSLLPCGAFDSIRRRRQSAPRRGGSN